MLTPQCILKALKEECDYHDGDPIVVGVSGGADSVALLHLLHSSGIPLAAAHVNYGLRGEESDGDEEFVSALCRDVNIPLYVRRTDRIELNTISSNLQDAARIFRHTFYNEICMKESVTWIALAHHADDQVETVIMNLMRGSGMRGLSGMQYVNGKIIRPMLDITRNEIENYLNAIHQEWRNDSSNQSDDYLRNRVRHHVVPALKAVDNRSGKGMLRSIQQITESNELLLELARPWKEKVVHHENGITRINKTALHQFPVPHILLNYLLDDCGVQEKFTVHSYSEFISGQTGKRFPGNERIMNDREEIILTHINGETNVSGRIYPGSLLSDWTCEVIPAVNPGAFTGNEALLNHDILKNDLIVRTWEDGDRMQPLGFGGTKKVSDILTEMKVPNYLRENYPVVTSKDEIVWIPGYRIAEKFKVTDETKTALHIKWNR